MSDTTTPDAGAASRVAAAWFFRSSEEGFALSRDGVLISVNPAWCVIADSRPLVEVGRRLETLFLPEDLPVLADLRRRIRTEAATVMEHRLPLPKGGYRWVRASMRRAEGPWTSIIVHDITAEREARAAQARTEDLRTQLAHLWGQNALGEMAAVLAHELNQPLAAIANYTEGARAIAASGPEPDAGLLEALDRAGGQAVRAGEIIRRMRRLVTQDLAPRQTDTLAKVVGEVAFMINLVAREGQTRIDYALATGADEVTVDPIQIQQVVMNLVRNAVEACEGRDDRRVLIETAAAEGGGGVLTVHDSGPGVAEGDLERLFRPMQSVKARGMGLGLSISRAIAEAHGGGLELATSRLGGAAFSLTLPPAA